MGGGTNPLLAQPLPQAAGQLRKDRGQLHGSATTRRCSYLLETNYCYLRISSKTPGQADDGSYDRGVVVIHSNVFDERFVDFETGHGELPQVAQARDPVPKSSIVRSTPIAPDFLEDPEYDILV